MLAYSHPDPATAAAIAAETAAAHAECDELLAELRQLEQTAPPLDTLTAAHFSRQLNGTRQYTDARSQLRQLAQGLHAAVAAARERATLVEAARQVLAEQLAADAKVAVARRQHDEAAAHLQAVEAAHAAHQQRLAAHEAAGPGDVSVAARHSEQGRALQAEIDYLAGQLGGARTAARQAAERLATAERAVAERFRVSIREVAEHERTSWIAAREALDAEHSAAVAAAERRAWAARIVADAT